MGWWRTGSSRAAALALAVCAVYAYSLSGGYLNYDDDWLIIRNPVLDLKLGSAMAVIFTDFSRGARLALGAEYLPLRDVSVWLDVSLSGRSPQAMRVVQLGFYVIAVLGFRAGFVHTFGRGRGEWIAWLFALHPVHVESVAWLAGRKDVLALAFMGLALWRHARGARDARFSVPALWLCACLSKSMSVGLLGPLLATDLYLRRRPDAGLYGASAVLVGLAMTAHVFVGGLVDMVSGPLSDSRWHAALTMGRVWLRYAGLSLAPAQLSVRHDVTLLQHVDGLSLLGWAGLFGSACAAAWAWRRHGTRWPATAWLWFVVPLLPVSQVLVPLQNLMADRYLWLSVAAPWIVVSHVPMRPSSRLRAWLTPLWMSLLVLFSAVSAARAALFRDSVALFADATAKTQRDPVAPYQLGKALESAGRDDEAMLAFQLTLDRSEPDHEAFRKASNNLAKLLAAHGRLPEAHRVLRQALRYWPKNPRIRSNYQKVSEALERARPAPQTGGGAKNQTGAPPSL